MLKYATRGTAILLLVWSVFLLGVPGKARAEDNLSKEADAVGKSVEKAARKTGDYLKSDSFRQDVGRVALGASKALQNGEKWVGDEIKKMHKSSSGAP
jgi:hypothetical protein